jgi:MFS family permease
MAVSSMVYRLCQHGKSVCSCSPTSHTNCRELTLLSTVFHHPTGSRLGLLGAFPGFGGFAVLLFTPYIADMMGRRLGTAIGCLLVIMGSIIQAFPRKDNPDAMFLAGRFIMGMGSNISNATCPLLITEVAHPRHRGRVTTVYNTLWYLGAIIAAWTTYGTLTHISSDLSWRLPVGLQCAMPGIQLLALYLLPEVSQAVHACRIYAKLVSVAALASQQEQALCRKEDTHQISREWSRDRLCELGIQRDKSNSGG